MMNSILDRQKGAKSAMTPWLPVWLPRLDRLSKKWWGYVDLNHGPLPYQGSALTG